MYEMLFFKFSHLIKDLFMDLWLYKLSGETSVNRLNITFTYKPCKIDMNQKKYVPNFWGVSYEIFWSKILPTIGWNPFIFDHGDGNWSKM